MIRHRKSDLAEEFMTPRKILEIAHMPNHEFGQGEWSAIR